MLRFLVVSAVCALALAVPFGRQKRQTVNNCEDYFKNVPNPCLNNPDNKVYFSHPSDSTKFIQCDRYQRMYVIQCPQTLEYSPSTSTCRSTSIIETTTHGSSQTHTPTRDHLVPTNPCTPEAMIAGNYYFPVQGDETKFIDCQPNGQANVVSCASGLVWNEARLSCVYKLVSGSTTSGVIGPVTPTSTTNLKNPCTAQNIAAKKLFFAHPDPTKFIQCDLWGDLYVGNCTAGLVWNQYFETCASPFFTVNGGAGK